MNTRAHALVVEQRELMRALFDELGDGVLVAQPGGTLSGMNRTARELTGLDDADIGRPLADLAATLQLREPRDGDLVAPSDTPLARALAGDRSSGTYAIVDPRDGARRELEVKAGPVRGAGDAIVAAVATIHDLTEIRRAEHEK
ncbi:MAG: PAS domain S-box protein, partial [Chloroflexi bacterium]